MTVIFVSNVRIFCDLELVEMAEKFVRKKKTLLRRRKQDLSKHFQKELRPALDFNPHYGSSYSCVFCGETKFEDFEYRFCEECFEKIKSWIGNQGDYHQILSHDYFPKECVCETHLKKTCVYSISVCYC